MKRARNPTNDLQYIAKVIALDNRLRDSRVLELEKQVEYLLEDVQCLVGIINNHDCNDGDGLGSIFDCSECELPAVIDEKFCIRCVKRWCRTCAPAFKRPFSNMLPEYQKYYKDLYLCDTCFILYDVK